MAEADKKLTGSFATAADGLVQALKVFEKRSKQASEANALNGNDQAAVAQAADVCLASICLNIVENQQRQDIEIAALKQRLAEIEKEIAPKVLDKSPFKASSPAAPK